jgi:RimJ/RimL family protein N-acetyltransferase
MYGNSEFLILPAKYDEVSFLREVHRAEDRSEMYCHIYEGVKPLIWYKVMDLDQLIGCCALLPIGKEARLRGWFLDPRYRGCGLGLRMAAFMADEARARGFSRIEAKTRATLDKHGWTWTGKAYPSWGGRQFVIEFKGVSGG